MILVALGAMDMMADKDRNVFEMPYDKGEMPNFALYDLHARIEKLQAAVDASRIGMRSA